MTRPGLPTAKQNGLRQAVFFTAKDARNIENNDAELEGLIKELIANHTIG